MKKIIRIIDKRVKEKFMMDDVYLNGYAKLCGWKATLAYISLCRHVNVNQFCFPSEKLMASEHSVSREVIMDGIKTLEQWNIIEVIRTRKNGKKRNFYTLLDKSVWEIKAGQVADSHKATQVADSHLKGSQQQPDQVAKTDIKETHNEGNTPKETHVGNASVAGKGINSIIGIFSRINPTINWKNKTIRVACEEMIERFGLEETKRMTEAVVAVQGQPYVPVATTPYEMREKLAKFKIYFDKQKNNSSMLKI